MAASKISETKRVQYLLGLCSPAERERIESEYFENEDSFQEMLTAEDDLIDAYARGELAGEERRLFEKSFVRSLHGRDRVQFARAFADAVSPTGSVETQLPGTLLDIFKTSRSAGLSRTATIAAIIVFVAVFAWLVIDRRRMTNELRELRAESAELSKRTEALMRSRDIERPRTLLAPQRRADLRRGRTAAQRARQLADVKNDRKEIPVLVKDAPIITSDATIGNTFDRKRMSQLPLNDTNVAGLLSLHPGVTHVAGGRTVLAIEGIKGGSPLGDSLTPWNINSSGETTIHIPRYLSWIRFQITLESAAVHEDYRVAIKRADGRVVTSVDWSEPLTPEQNIIDTPFLSTGDLLSGDYLLLLMGKEVHGSFVKVAEYSFKVINY